jgi:hypothetical protein
MTILKKIFFIFLTLIILLYLFTFYQTYIGGGYKYIQGRVDDWHIEKNNEVVIGSTVLSINTKSNFIFGIRLPSEHLECDGNYKIRLINRDEYFILNTETGGISEFKSKNLFEENLKKLGLLDGVTLNYSLLRSTWDKYSEYYKNVDFSKCVPLNSFDYMREK